MDNNPEQPVSQPVNEPTPEAPGVAQPAVEQPAEQPVAERPVEQPAAERPVEQLAGQPAAEQPVNTQTATMAQTATSQPTEKTPKEPMSPATKKKIILGCVIGGIGLVLGIVAAIVIPMLLKINYGETYKIAKELKPKIYEIYRNYDCDYVIDYVSSTYTTPKSYSGYIENCKKAYGSAVNDLVNQLGDSDGVKKNDEIKNQFDKFKAEYSSLSAGDAEALAEKLSLWQAVHDFTYAVDDLTMSSPDSGFKTAANYLIESGNDTLKAYGEGWLERVLGVTAAYRAYQSSPWQTSAEAYTEYNNKSREFSDWRSANSPSISTVAPLDFSDSSRMYSEFSTLYDLIVKTYEKNYDFGSNTCTEFLNEVFCE